MSELVCVTVAGIPESVNHIWRATKGGNHYKTAKARDFETLLINVLRKQHAGRPACDGAVRLTVEITRKTRRRYDLDNRIKSVQDCLAPAGIICDDSQVVELVARKTRGEEDTTTVIVEALEADHVG